MGKCLSGQWIYMNVESKIVLKVATQERYDFQGLVHYLFERKC